MATRHALLLLLLGVCFVAAALGAEEDGLVVKVVQPPPLLEPPPPAAPGNSTGESKTIADVIDQALKKEFHDDTEKIEKQAGKSFNESVTKEEGQLETVVRISGHKDDKASSLTNSTAAAAPAETQQEAPADDAALPVTVTDKPAAVIPKFDTTVDRIIDSKDNEFVLSSSKDSFAGLTLDPQLIQDLTFILSASAVMGMLFESIKQPVINGYLVAGALVGPGGFKLIKELVQVESLAQLGVELLLFNMGLELNFGRLRQVWGVAILGGTLQILASIAIVAVLAVLSGAALNQGVFIGALLSMSSTSVVMKCLEMGKSLNSTYGQITMGTLILQDCSVGLLFALMPVLSPGIQESMSGSELAEQKAAVAMMIIQVLLKLGVALALVALVSRTVLPLLLRLLKAHASKELVQLTLVGICFITAWTSGHFGLSEELGSFLAGTMIAVAEQAGHETGPGVLQAQSPGHKHTAEYVESVTNVLTALFVASIGLIMSPIFLMEHIVVLTGGVVVVVLGKALLVASIVNLFGVPWRTSFAVGISLAHIGEFSFVLLSMAHHHKLLPQQERMLLLGVTGLSLLTSPSIVYLSMKLVQPTRQQREREGTRTLDVLETGSTLDELELRAKLLSSSGSSSKGTADEEYAVAVVRPGLHAPDGGDRPQPAQHARRAHGVHTPAAQ